MKNNSTMMQLPYSTKRLRAHKVPNKILSALKTLARHTRLFSQSLTWQLKESRLVSTRENVSRFSVRTVLESRLFSRV